MTVAQETEQKVVAEVAPEVTKATEEPVADAETNEEQVSRISAAIARAKGALEEVKAKVSEYDKQYKASETASAYLGGPIQKAQTAFDDLAATAAMLKDKTVEIPTKALTRTLTAANGALEQISETANKYDDKFQLSATVQKAVSVPREKCSAALVEVSSLAASVSAAANAKLQGVNHGIVSRAQSLALGGASLIFSTAAALDGRYALEDKTKNYGTKALDKAQELDTKYNVKERASTLASNGLERARGLDSTVTGGRVTPLVLSAFEKGLELATGGLSFVQAGYESAKQDRQGTPEKEGKEEPPLAPIVDAAAAKPEAPPATNEVAATQ